MPALPNLIIIGAQKAGTTSLHRYLGAHPEIQMSATKELNFFDGETWEHGADWYAAQFSAEAPVRGEASPRYSAYPEHPGVPERMATVVPDAKLIYLVRDPVARIESQYEHLGGDSLEACVREPATSSAVARSRYWMQLSRYLRCFAAEQILIVDQHELLAERAEQLRRVHAFLGVDPGFSAFVHAREFNRRNGALMQSPRGRRGWGAVQRAVGRERMHLLKGASLRLREDVLGQAVVRPQIDLARHPELERILRAEVEALREHTGLAFSAWDL